MYDIQTRNWMNQSQYINWRFFHFLVESLDKKFQSAKVHIWDPTHILTKNLQNEHFQVESLNKKFHIS